MPGCSDLVVESVEGVLGKESPAPVLNCPAEVLVSQVRGVDLITRGGTRSL